MDTENFHNQNKQRSVLKVKDLSLSIESQSLFTNVNLNIERGSISTLIGPSGSGKTSFLKCLNRLVDTIPHHKVSGQIWFQGNNILGENTDLVPLRRSVGMIFQRPNPFPVSIYKNLEIPLKEHGIKDRSTIQSIVEESFKRVGLWMETKDRLQSSALKLSGGQQQRLCLARAIALKPQVLLMDEPCSALDPISTGVIEDLTLELKQRYTVVVVTHNLAQARRLGDSTSLFWHDGSSGGLVEHGPTEKIFNDPTHEVTSAYIRGERC